MGLVLASLGPLGLGLLYVVFGTDPETAEQIHGIAMGAGVVALSYRVGGGIFTRSADVGADLVGKVEAGMGSDIFESTNGATIATVALATVLVVEAGDAAGGNIGGSMVPAMSLMSLPLLLSSLGLLCSVAAIFAVNAAAGKAPATALRIGTFAAAGGVVILSLFLMRWIDVGIGTRWAVLVGSVGGVIIGLSTESYTGGKPVRHIARSGETGPATVIIAGLSVGMQSVVIPILTIGAMIFVANLTSGRYWVGIAAVSMHPTVAMTMAIDAYGPVADNAGGIAEMSAMGPETRAITDELDEDGNTTAAIGEGVAIGAAALAALTLINPHIAIVDERIDGFSLRISDPDVLIGMFSGGSLPFLVASITITAVGDAALEMIEEIRRQFREVPGLLEGKAEPDAVRCVDIATKAAVKDMLLPAAIAVLSPVNIGFGFGAEALGDFLGGALLGAVLLALTMANAGGAWDDAKRHVEQANHGGKGSEAHSSNVVGDTVGDQPHQRDGQRQPGDRPAARLLIHTARHCGPAGHRSGGPPCDCVERKSSFDRAITGVSY